MNQFKSILVFVTLFCLNGFLFSQKKEINLIITHDSLTRLTSVLPKPVETLKFFKYDPKCGLDLGIYLKDSLPDGEYWISKNGKLDYIGYYKNSLKTGLWKFYDKEGEVFKKERWENGVLFRTISTKFNLPDSVNGPILKFDSNVIYINETIKKNNISYRRKIKIQNVGSKPLIIYSAKTGDGGTFAEFPREIIPPGDSAFILFVFSYRRPPKYSRTLSIRSNSIGGEYTSRIIIVEFTKPEEEE